MIDWKNIVIYLIWRENFNTTSNIENNSWKATIGY